MLLNISGIVHCLLLTNVTADLTMIDTRWQKSEWTGDDNFTSNDVDDFTYSKIQKKKTKKN